MHEMWEMQGQQQQTDRRYVMPAHSDHSPSGLRRGHHGPSGGGGGAAEDLHAWSIYRQNLNSDFTDSALGSDERSPLPYGNFQLREQTVQSILRHPRLAPRSELGSNMYAYLKFGLPRVFPPAANSSAPTPNRLPLHKDASSGYDSANDERNHSPMTQQQHHHNNIHNMHPGHQRSRSRLTDHGGRSTSQGHHHGGHGHGGHHTLPHHGDVLRTGRARSETDLREGLVNNRFTSATSRDNRKLRGANSEANLIHDQMRPISKNGSQISLVSRQSRPGLLNGHSHKSGGVVNNGHTFYSAMHTGEGSIAGGLDSDAQDTYFKHPHLQVRGLSYEISGRGKTRVLDGISFDLRGGEMMALMTTTAGEGTAMLDILAGRRPSRGRVGGEFLLNGNPVTLSRLGSRVAYVRRDYRLHPDITVAQTMRFHSLLRRPIRTASTHDKGTRMNALLEELGLTAVRHSLVDSLTSAERQRLAVACQLLLDTDIVLLDQVTRGMDIFDTFFLVDYLRQWGRISARIILMTIHPPGFEVFSMFTKVALTSMGRLMFYGHRREMLPYFAFIEYPCPGFKNPSDYYLDLVTLDDLSAEALLESSQRIETLADSYRRKQEPLAEPGPPAPLPPKVKEAGAFMQIWAIWMYTIVFTFPWNILRWLVYMLTSAALSIAVGAIFWNVRLRHEQDQNSANDRLGQHWTLMGLTPWPIILILAARDVVNIKYITRDNEERLYSKGAFILAKTIIELPFIISIFLAYIIPAYVMAGISSDTDEMKNFYKFVGYMLLYLYALRMCLLAFTHLFRGLVVGATFGSAVALTLALSAGYLVHSRDLGDWCNWVRFLSPVAWLFQPIIRDEFEKSLFECPKNPTVNQENIVVRVECGIKDGPSALEYWSLPTSGPIWIALLATAGFIFVSYIFSFVGFILRRHAPAIPPPEKP